MKAEWHWCFSLPVANTAYGRPSDATKKRYYIDNWFMTWIYADNFLKYEIYIGFLPGNDNNKILPLYIKY